MGKILHYLYGIPPVRRGGLIDYALDLAEVQRKEGYTVELLVPGTIWGRNKKSVRIKKKKYQQFNLYCIQNPLPIPMACGIRDIEWYTGNAGFEKYKKFLNKAKPDIIHIHSLMGIHESFFRAAKDLNIRIVYTSHDYFGICPKTDLLKNEKVCEDEKWLNCKACCCKGFGTWHLILDQSFVMRLFMKQNYALKVLQYVMQIKANVLESKKNFAVEKENPSSNNIDYEKLRRYYCAIWEEIDFFHFNSNIAKDEFQKRIGSVKGAVIPICNKYCADHRKLRMHGQVVRIGYFANNSIHKGFYELKKVLDLLYKEGYHFKLNIYFSGETDKTEYIDEHAPYKRDKLEEIYNQNDVVVMPSLWKETYGLVALEALSFGVPVIMSENVGAKILLEQNREPIGKIYENGIENLYSSIKQVLTEPDILDQWNLNICNSKIKFSMVEHVKEMMNKCYGGKYEEGKHD